MGLSLPSTSFFGIRFARIFARFVRVCPLTPGGQARVRPRAIYILPTGAGVVFAGILLLMLLGSLNYQNNLGLLFTFLTVAVVVVSMHHAWFNLLGLALSARAGRPVFAGDRALFDLQVVVETRKRRPDLRLVVGDQVALLDLVPGQDARTTLGVPTRRRGLQALGQVTLETRYPLGLFRCWCYLETAAAPIRHRTSCQRPGGRGIVVASRTQGPRISSACAPIGTVIPRGSWIGRPTDAVGVFRSSSSAAIYLIACGWIGTCCPQRIPRPA
jgi:hypothetical protein